MKTSFSLLKTFIYCFLLYKSLLYAFLFLVSGMWIITALLIILFGYLSRSVVLEVTEMLKTYKSFQHSGWKERVSGYRFKLKTVKRFSSETL